jgi:transglutaminase-like putative cysteine protease
VTKPPPAPLPFLRERLLAVGTLAAIAPVPLFFTYALEVGLLALYLLTLGFVLFRASRGRILRLSNLALNLAGLLYLPVYFLDVRYGSRSLLRATLHLLLFTLVFKLTSLRRERDLSMALVLCTFLFVASVSTSFHYSILLFVAAFCLVAWPVLVRWSLWRDLAAAPDEWGRDPRARELPGRGSLSSSVAAALLLAVPFFIGLPRLRAPYVRGVTSGQEVTTGISETAEPDLYVTLKRSDRVVARVTAAEPLTEADAGLLRLRMVAYASWDGRVWRSREGRRRLQPAGGGVLVPLGARRAPLADERKVLSIDLLPLDSRYVPYPIRGTALRFPEGTFRGWASAQVERDDARNVKLFFKPDRTLRFEAFYGDRAERDLSPGPLPEASAAPDSPVLARLARERTRGLDPTRDPEAAAAALEQWLRSDFTYALESLPPGPNGVERFLLEKKSGHCQSFATAMALLLREIGIPSRFVAGFAGGEIGPFGRYILVRGEHAHAWVEAWCGEKGWMPFDPTPAVGVPGVTRLPLFSRLRQLTDGLEFLYDRYILGFTQGDQIELIRSVREAAGTLVESARQAVERLRGVWGAAVGTAGRVAAAAIVFAVAAALLLVLFLSRRGLLGRSRPLAPAAATYRKLQRILRRRGARLPPSAAPAETLEAARSFGRAAGGAAAEIVLAYARESFGGAPLAASEAERLAGRLKRFRDDLRRNRK